MSSYETFYNQLKPNFTRSATWQAGQAAPEWWSPMDYEAQQYTTYNNGTYNYSKLDEAALAQAAQRQFANWQAQQAQAAPGAAIAPAAPKQFSLGDQSLGDYLWQIQNGLGSGGNDGNPEWRDANLGLNAMYNNQGGYRIYDSRPYYASDSGSGNHFDKSKLNGSAWADYDAQGNLVNKGNWEGLTKRNTFTSDVLPFLMVAAPFAAAIAGAGAGAAGAAGAAGSGGSTAATGSTLATTGIEGASSGAFLGEGVASGIGAWDGALAAAGAGGGTTAMGAAGAGGGTPPPANPYLSGAGSSGGGTLGSIQNILGGAGTASDWLGLAGTALGAYGGSQGQEASTTSSRAMDPRMDALFYGQLAPTAQGLLGATTAQAQLAGSQLMSKGSGLLGQTAPNTATNPYAVGILNDLQRRHGDMIDQRLLQTQGNAVATGGLGGSRQGVAQAQAISQGADNFTGQAANFMGGLYNQDQNRLRQDWTLGSGMLSQGVNLPFAPAQNTAQIYSPFTGYGTTTNSQQTGGGWMGAVGGALGAAQAGKNMGWW